MTTTDIGVIILVLAIGALGLLVLPAYMTRRSVTKVARIFRQKNAIGPANAMTVDELGLRPKGLLERMAGPRDWKPKALDWMIQSKLVQIDDDGKLYMEESALNRIDPPKIR